MQHGGNGTPAVRRRSSLIATVVPQGSTRVNCHCQTTPARNWKVLVVVVVVESVEV
jgi:hypothetical protein